MSLSSVGGPAGSQEQRDGAHPTLDELRAEALEWGRKPRRYGSWYVTEHMVRAMRAYGWTIIIGADVAFAPTGLGAIFPALDLMVAPAAALPSP